LRPHEEELKMAREVFRPLWEAAMRGKGEQERHWCCSRYARLEPWASYDYVNAHLKKELKNHFIYHALPWLYAANAEEALAAIESIDWGEGNVGNALLTVISGTPNLGQSQKLELLERAAQHLQAATDPADRVSGLSRVALRLFDLGKMEEARKIVALAAPAAKQFSPKTSAAACVTAGQAIALFDLPAGLRLIYAARDAGDENYWIVALFRVAYRIAPRQPAEAERLAVAAIDSERQSSAADFRRENHREPREDEVASTITWHEQRLVPLGYHLAAADAARAEQVAKSIHSPYLRAYAVGMVAKALAPTQRAAARRLLLEAYDTMIAEGLQRQEQHWLLWPLDPQPSTVAAALLPVAEEIDPTLVGDCLWRAVSFRIHRPTDAFLLWLQPESSDAALAAFVARYDRKLARALMPRRAARVVPANYELDYDCLPSLAAIDACEALKELQAEAPVRKADAIDRFANTFYLMGVLPIASPHRWDWLAGHYNLWIPDNQYAENSSWW
jgi:hypothetical protein